MNTFKKLDAIVVATSAVGATLTGCGGQNTLVKAADQVRKKEHCEAVELFSNWDVGDFKFLRGERSFQEVSGQTWAMYITVLEEDKEKLNPGSKRFEISQSGTRMWN